MAFKCPIFYLSSDELSYCDLMTSAQRNIGPSTNLYMRYVKI